MEFDPKNKKQVCRLLRQHFSALGHTELAKAPEVAVYYVAACAYLRQFAEALEQQQCQFEGNQENT